MRSRKTSPRKRVSPAVSVVVILVVLALVVVAGYLYLKPRPKQGPGPPQMTAQERKDRMAESAIWGEEMKRAKLEHRLPDYSKLPRSGHMGAPAAPVQGKPGQ